MTNTPQADAICEGLRNAAFLHRGLPGPQFEPVPEATIDTLLAGHYRRQQGIIDAEEAATLCGGGLTDILLELRALRAGAAGHPRVAIDRRGAA